MGQRYTIIGAEQNVRLLFLSRFLLFHPHSTHRTKAKADHHPPSPKRKSIFLKRHIRQHPHDFEW